MPTTQPTLELSFSASGTPQQVKASITEQAKGARKAHAPEAGATIASLKDYLAALASQHGPEDTVIVSATVTVTVQARPAAPSTISVGATLNAPTNIPALESVPIRTAKK